jgi:DNA polymerase III delta prime subunit
VATIGVSTPTISIKEARKLLGKEAKNYTNDELEKLITDYSGLIRKYIKSLPKF